MTDSNGLEQAGDSESGIDAADQRVDGDTSETDPAGETRPDPEDASVVRTGGAVDAALDGEVGDDEGPIESGPRESGSASAGTSTAGGTVPVAAFVAAVLVAGALGILAVFALGSGGDGSPAEEREARLAAGRFAETLLSFDHGDLDEWKADVLALSTGGFVEEVEDVEAGLRRLIAETEITTSTEVTDIFLGEIDRSSVEAVVIYDRTVTSASNARTESDRYLQVLMIRADGAWLVDEVVDILSAGGIGSAPTGSTSTDPTADG